MKKKNILFILSSVTLCLLMLMLILNLQNNDKNILENSKDSNKIVKNNTLTMMYETDYQSGEYQISNDTSWPQDGYTFNEILSKCENGSKLTWDDENKKVLVQTNTSDKCYVYFDKNPLTLANYIINKVYTGTDGENGLYYHDGIGTYTNASLEAGDNSYRYSGANPDNYVCFGSDAASCPSDNLYRIIGVFDEEVKLIKNSSIGDYKWDNDAIDFNSIAGVNNQEKNYMIMKLGDILAAGEVGGNGLNKWAEADLNYYINNDYFYDILTYEWKDKIANHTWQVGGMSSTNVSGTNAQITYNYEIKSNSANTTYQAKIGLMYVSDYYYSAEPTYWSYPYIDYNVNKDENWMYVGLDEWTITPQLSNTALVYIVTQSGYLSDLSVSFSIYNVAVRPTFYLNSDVVHISGMGTYSNPYRIA